MARHICSWSSSRGHFRSYHAPNLLSTFSSSTCSFASCKPHKSWNLSSLERHTKHHLLPIYPRSGRTFQKPSWKSPKQKQKKLGLIWPNNEIVVLWFQTGETDAIKKVLLFNWSFSSKTAHSSSPIGFAKRGTGFPFCSLHGMNSSMTSGVHECVPASYIETTYLPWNQNTTP